MSTTDLLIDDTPDESAPRPQVVERYRTQELSTTYRLQMLAGKLADQAVSAGGIALLLLPFLVAGMLLADIPATLFDDWVAKPSLKPSQWLSRGDLFQTMGVFLLVLMARRHGGQITHQALALSWIITLALTLMMLIYLAPSLEPGDLPGGRYMLGLLSSWYAGAWVAVALYDMTRGSRWWRPPFVALAVGLGVQSALYTFIVYAGTGVPWVFWAMTNIMLQLVMTLGLVALYRSVRHKFRPRAGLVSGFGGR